jgi:hypothetical protein
MVYYSMDNLRGRLGSTRHERGLGCNADSSTTFAGQRDNYTVNAAFSVLCGVLGGWRDGRGMCLLDSRKPHAEKKMHTRSQQLLLEAGSNRCKM